jgi:long-chain acyl-CoA synthetase
MLAKLLSNAALLNPEKIAVIGAEQSLSYRQLDAASAQFADLLIARGMQAGDRVILHAGNHPLTLIAFWGVLKAGAVACILHSSTKATKLARISERLGTRWVLDHTEIAAMCSTFAEALAAAKPIAELQAIDPKPTDLAMIVFTSGSLGEPKGVMMSHSAVLSACQSIQAYLGYQSSDTAVSNLPLSFDYGLYQALLCTQVGATLKLLPEQLQSFKHRSELDTATVLPVMPALVALWQHIPDWQPNLSVRLITSTGAAVASAAIAWLTKMFPNARFFSMFGLTECKRVSYLPPEKLAQKPRSVGIAIPGTRLWIADTSGHPAATGCIGELVVSGPHLMSGYWEDAVGTAKRLKADPASGETVLFTGDHAYLDSDGDLYFAWRTDGSIKARGVKVSPREVELSILEIPGVADVAVYGVVDVMQGEAIAAAVILTPGIKITVAQLRAHCSQRLEHALMPKHIHILDTLPLTENGKVDKAMLPCFATQ